MHFCLKWSTFAGPGDGIRIGNDKIEVNTCRYRVEISGKIFWPGVCESFPELFVAEMRQGRLRALICAFFYKGEAPGRCKSASLGA
jgi:hypothetical protein